MKFIKSMAVVAFAAAGLVGCVGGEEDIATGDEQNATEEKIDINAPAKSGGEVEIWRSDENDQFYFHLIAKNGETVLSSEGYESLDGAAKAAKSLKQNGQLAASFTLRKKASSKSQWYFTVEAGNGETLGVSETYSSKTKAITGAKTVQGLLKGKTKLDYWTDQCGFELFVGDDSDIWFRLRAENGEKLLISEGYSSEKAAKTAIDTVVTTSIISDYTNGEEGDLPAYVVFEGEDGQFYWNLVAANNETVASGGEGFETAAAARASVELVKEHANEEAACWTTDGPVEL